MRLTFLALAIAQAGATTCPAGPFQLHDFAYNASASSAAYFIVVCDLAATTRLDPLMAPGACNSHMHSVFGSNRFGATVSLADVTLAPGELANTTCNIPADGSMYWAPSLYFKNRTSNKYFLVPAYNKAYYFNRGSTMPMQRMPVGLRMIRGDAYRTRPLVAPAAIKNDTVNIFWMDSNETGGFPAWVDRGDWQTRTMFPNCWDGENLKTAVPGINTHMAFRSESNGTCPPAHPVRVPQLFVEVNYQIEKYAGAAHPESVSSDFVLATGDTKGWGAHVDYISGWQQDALSAALHTCINTDENNPNCTFHQFSSVTPAFSHALSGGANPVDREIRPGGYALFKPAPVEEVDGLDALLVTGKEAHSSGFPVAKCHWGAARDEPAPLLNKLGVLNKTNCHPAPGPTPTDASTDTEVP